MSSFPSTEPVGVLLSGGLDSAILLSHLLAQGETVRPFYIRTGVVWEAAERRAVHDYLAAVALPRLLPLVEFELPLADLYEQHWSLNGRDVPDAASPDEAVFLPGRNALLLLKPAIWCQRHGLARLALGPLASNPFPDARPEFFCEPGNNTATVESDAVADSPPVWRVAQNRRHAARPRVPFAAYLELHRAGSRIAARNSLRPMQQMRGTPTRFCRCGHQRPYTVC